MISIASLTKRVISLTAIQSLSYQTSVSLAFTTTRTFSPSAILLGSNPLQRSKQQQQQWENHYRCTPRTAMTDADASRDDATFVVSAGMVSDESKLVKDMLYRIRDCNRMPDDFGSRIVEFQLDGCVLGKVDARVAEMLCSTRVATAKGGPLQPVFEMVPTTSSSTVSGNNKAHLTLSEEACGTTVESRSHAVALVMQEMKEKGFVKGWRDELYPVSESFYNPPMFLMERAATDLLGVLSYGVHINGILQDNDDNDNDNNDLPRMWMARRSKTKSKYPSMLDHIVAGGQPAGLSLMENVIKECEEEAGIPPEIARPGCRPAGVVSYEEAQEHTLGSSSSNNNNNNNGNHDTTSKEEQSSFFTISRVVLFNYDLDLPKDFVPQPVDGEVEEFFLWTIDQIKESMAPDYEDPIKPNCYLVIIDYLLRMGFVSPETNGYLDVLQELRSGDCR